MPRERFLSGIYPNIERTRSLFSDQSLLFLTSLDMFFPFAGLSTSKKILSSRMLTCSSAQRLSNMRNNRRAKDLCPLPRTLITA